MAVGRQHTHLHSLLFVVLPVLCNILSQRVIRIGSAQQCLNAVAHPNKTCQAHLKTLLQRLVATYSCWKAQQGGTPQQNRPYLQSRTPFVFQDVQADAAELVNIWMIDLCQEADLCQKTG